MRHDDRDEERRRCQSLVERRMFAPGSTLAGLARPGEVHEDSPHQTRREREEVRPVLPGDGARVDQPQIALVHEAGRLQRVMGTFPAHEARAVARSSASTRGVSAASAASSPWLQAWSRPVIRWDDAMTPDPCAAFYAAWAIALVCEIAARPRPVVFVSASVSRLWVYRGNSGGLSAARPTLRQGGLCENDDGCRTTDYWSVHAPHGAAW